METWAFMLLAVGVLLLVAEVFIPSGGLIFTMAATSLVGAVVCAWNAWGSQNPTYFWSFMASMAFLLPVTAGVAFAIWPHTPMGRRAILEGPTSEEVTPFAEITERYRRLVGRVGETVTALNPAGIVRIDGERIHCQSEGMILDAGIPVRIVSVQGTRVVVRRCLPEEAEAERPAPDPGSTGSTDSPLDFDMT